MTDRIVITIAKTLYRSKKRNMRTFFAKLQLEFEFRRYFPLKKSEKKPTSLQLLYYAM
jgi:hypothetical protein